MSIYKYTLGASGAGARGRRGGPPGAGAGRRVAAARQLARVYKSEL